MVLSSSVTTKKVLPESIELSELREAKDKEKLNKLVMIFNFI